VVFSSLLPVSLCLSVCLYSLLSVCLYISLSVLVLIQIWSMYFADSSAHSLIPIGYPTCLHIRVNRSLCFLFPASSGISASYLAVLLSVYFHVYYTKLNSLIDSLKIHQNTNVTKIEQYIAEHLPHPSRWTYNNNSLRVSNIRVSNHTLI